RYDVVSAYSFYAPTARWDPRDQASVGRGYWINQLSLGGAVYFDTTRNQRASILISYERNQPRRLVESKRGDLLNVQGGAGAGVYKNVTAGFAAYALWQVADDRGADLPPELTGMHTRAFGLGPEIDVTIPKLRMRVDVRAEWDFGVVAHPQGLLFVVGVQYLAWMPAITTGASPLAGSSGRPDSRP
ncbi:MAG TPA: transporter, partial [Gemmatimonadaceae bacterium]